MILQKNITTNYESNAIWKKWMKILQRIKLQHSKYGTEVTNTVSLLFSLKSSKEINTKSLWFIWACHRDETEHGESKNKIFLKRKKDCCHIPGAWLAWVPRLECPGAEGTGSLCRECSSTMDLECLLPSAETQTFRNKWEILTVWN